MQTFAQLAPMLVLASVCLALVPSASSEDAARLGPIEEIFVTMEDGRKFAVNYVPGGSIKDVKQRIEDLEGIPLERQKLSLGDKEFYYDDVTLSEYEIKPNADLALTLDTQEAQMYVYVKTSAAINEYVHVYLDQSVEELKQSVTRMLTGGRESHANLRLILNGRSLRDDRKLLEYPIWPGTTVLQGKPLEDCRGDAEIFVRTLSGATIKCQVDLAATVAKLEQLVEAQTGVASEAQVLIYGRNRLRSEDHLCDHGLESGAIVNLALYSGQVKEMRLTSAKSPYEVPIFREANDSEVDAGRREDIVQDGQNWLPESEKFVDILDLFNVTAQLRLLEPELQWFNELTLNMRKFKTIGADDNMALYHLLSARRRMHSTVWPYQFRMITNENFPNIYDGHGIRLGANWKRGEHLRADINNYAPDGFTDDEIINLFKKTESVRRQLAGGARTGNLSSAELKRLNREVLDAYARALRHLPPILEILDHEYVGEGDYLTCRGLRYDARGMQLGASWQPGEHLGLNINNYAPDAFSDNELMSLFDKSEIARRQLESDARTGEVHMSLDEQKEINRELLRAYLEALSDLLPMAKIGDDEQVDEGECPICYDALVAEPAVKLPCGHAMHLDCISEWARELRIERQVATCPYCRQPFKAPNKLFNSIIE